MGIVLNGLNIIPYTSRKSKSKRIKSFYSCSCFFFCRYVGLRPLDMFSLRSNSIYCRFASIRYEKNPSFA